MKLRDTPIQLKLIRIILLTTGAVLLLTCTSYFTYELITFKRSTKSHLSTLGRIIANNSTAALAFDSREEAYEILSALKAEKHVVAACLYDKEGRIFAAYPASIDTSILPSSPGREVYLFSSTFLEGFEPVVQADNRLGTLYLKSDMEAVYNWFRVFGVLAFFIVTGSILFAYFLSRRLQKTISQPILDLAETAKRISEKRDYSVRAVKAGNDEVGTLTDAFNHMLEQIEAKDREITEFNLGLETKIRERTYELESAYNALKRQNEFIETIIDSSVDVIAVFDRELRYVIVNKHAEDVYGKKRSDIIGRNVADVFPQVKGGQMIRDIQRALQGETVYNSSYISPVINRHFENFFIPLHEANGEVFQVLAIGHDVTNIMIANEQLKTLNSELEKSNRDLEQFASVASHDLQEPLRKIQIFSELAEKSVRDPETCRKYLSKVSASALRMARLIQAVLNYSRVSTGRGSQIETVDLNQIVDNIRSDLELVIAEKGAVINTTNLPSVKGIPLQLNQLFLNLISNSLKFSRRKPVITIGSRLIRGEELGKLTEGPVDTTYVHLIFTDNGIGFEQHLAEKVFTIFQRLHSAKEFAGTGIGLALCKRIVENHKGFITVKSEPDKGSTFDIYLPAGS